VDIGAVFKCSDKTDFMCNFIMKLDNAKMKFGAVAFTLSDHAYLVKDKRLSICSMDIYEPHSLIHH